MRGAGIATAAALFEGARTPKQRASLPEKTGLSEKQILKFANMVDLFRISGVGSEYADLLEAAGVDTVPELAQRNAANLAKKLAEVNEAKSLTRRVPSETEVTKWAEQAKTLPRAIEY